MPVLPPCNLLPPPFPLSQLNFIPQHDPSSYKGSSGCRFLTVGASPPYFGALAYASAATLQAGADMTTALTLEDAVADNLRNCPLTSAETMVYSSNLLPPPDIPNFSNSISGTLIGPGLSRAPSSQSWACTVASSLPPSPSKCIVLDADALWPSSSPSILETLLPPRSPLILTPNIVEFNRLVSTHLPDSSNYESESDKAQLCKLLRTTLNVTGIILKGPTDIITTEHCQLTCSTNGSSKRCGGLGDVLSGLVVVFVSWFLKYSKAGDVSVALWCACAVCRESGRRAYGKKRRAMQAKDVIEEIGGVVEEVWPLFDE
ncbi:hypothetical protein TrVE_jg4989 [Triparma verrucosa]|uniref:ATP-dependent (S)-NAD(P)H-hydrate dehydratase n=1 Tax=Triparma verrucosa TaxID=1606542 RepID=A0A9W7CFG3_9STRA|nr:hypothetical protein TrVE_jg4989 [Triparma verrucosa]